MKKYDKNNDGWIKGYTYDGEKIEYLVERENREILKFEVTKEDLKKNNKRSYNLVGKTMEDTIDRIEEAMSKQLKSTKKDYEGSKNKIIASLISLGVFASGLAFDILNFGNNINILGLLNFDLGLLLGATCSALAAVSCTGVISNSKKYINMYKQFKNKELKTDYEKHKLYEDNKLYFNYLKHYKDILNLLYKEDKKLYNKVENVNFIINHGNLDLFTYEELKKILGYFNIKISNGGKLVGAERELTEEEKIQNQQKRKKTIEDVCYFGNNIGKNEGAEKPDISKGSMMDRQENNVKNKQEENIEMKKDDTKTEEKVTSPYTYTFNPESSKEDSYLFEALRNYSEVITDSEEQTESNDKVLTNSEKRKADRAKIREKKREESSDE